MKISHSWLQSYLNIPLDKEDTENFLTNCGLEVEGTEDFETVKGGLKGLVIGKIIEKKEHPNADRLVLAKVDLGNGDQKQIVCGAPNLEKGQKVVVAPPGTTLFPTFDGAIKIKKSKIRGEVSEGMICAEDEIGIGTHHDGVVVLDASAHVGMPASEYFKVERDKIYEIGLTPNRADATSHIGVARDLVAIFKSRGREEAHILWPDIADFTVDNKQRAIAVKIEDKIGCTRYSGLTISGVKVRQSPKWLQNRLKSIGLTPKNNIVDVTNFVMHEMGQPMHAFDADTIKGDEVVVKSLKEGTKFNTLDEVERKLSSEDLMICDANGGICIAGVFGGTRSAVTDKTKNIFLESAYFNPVYVRKTAKRHGLSTDASFRFERGTDPNITVYALKRAALMIRLLSGGDISSEIVDHYPEKIENTLVNFRYRNCNRLIGHTINKETIKHILTSLEIKIDKETDDDIALSVPPFKVDVKREADLIEEVLRIYGYNQIPMPGRMQSSLAYTEKPDKEAVKNSVAGLLSGKGFSEIMSNSLTRSDYYEQSKDCDSKQTVKILNPLSSELNAMRQTLLFNGLETIAHNVNRKQANLKLYEFGNTYRKIKNQYNETFHLSLLITGGKEPESWNSESGEADFYLLKGYVHAVFNRLGINPDRLQTNTTEAESWDYGLQYLVNNNPIAVVSKVNKGLLEKFDVAQNVYYADFNWDNIMQLVKTQLTYRPLPKFPEVRRDLALLLNKNVKFSAIQKIAQKTEKKLLRSVNLFDVYEGKNIEKGKKSYAVSFVFLDENKTLTDEEVDGVMNKLIQRFEEELGAKLR